MATLIVDDTEITVKEKTRLLHALLDNGIYIPSLCSVPDMDPVQGTTQAQSMETAPASCRLCFVEIEGYDRPVPSCTIIAEDGMIIKTNTPRVRRLQKTAFELLLSVHVIDCRNCPANKKCELQKIAGFLKVPLKQKRIEYIERHVTKENNHPFLIYDPDKCVMCGRCVSTCRKLYNSPYLSFAGRGLNMTISFFGETEAGKIPCDDCYACVDVCPVAALLKKSSIHENHNIKDYPHE